MANTGYDQQQAAGNSGRAFQLPRQKTLLALAILAVTFGVYAPTLRYGFVFEDLTLIEQNDWLRSWSHLPGYFAHELWYYRYPHMLTNVYRPLLLVWLRLNFVAFGLRPWGWRLSIVAAHAAATWLVYRLALRLTRSEWTSASAALIFGLHPVHVETIAEPAWADQPLSTLFILAALLSYWRSRQARHGAGWLAASLAMCAGALLSKESGLALPLMVSGLAAVYAGEMAGNQTAGRTDILERLRFALIEGMPYWAVVAAYLPLRVWALKKFTYIVTPMPVSQVLFTIPSVLVFYLRLLIWPAGLSCYYNTPYISSFGWSGFALPAALLAGLATLLAVWIADTGRQDPRDAKAMTFACLWLILTIAPVLNFRFLVVTEIAHDRYLYLPSVGFSILAAIALRQVLAALPGNLPRQAAAVAALGLFAVMIWATIAQSQYWSDDVTLNRRACEIAPRNASAITNLATAMGHAGREDEAMALYRQALAIQPRLWRANVNLAYLYYMRADYRSAALYFADACAADSSDADQFAYLGLSLLHLGRPKDAEMAMRTALDEIPDGRNFHLGLGVVLEAEGNFAAARREMEAELANDPGNVDAQAHLRKVDVELQSANESHSAGKLHSADSASLK